VRINPPARYDRVFRFQLLQAVRSEVVDDSKHVRLHGIIRHLEPEMSRVSLRLNTCQLQLVVRGSTSALVAFVFVDGCMWSASHVLD
jgi:hypothetical protein